MEMRETVITDSRSVDLSLWIATQVDQSFHRSPKTIKTHRYFTLQF